MEEATDLSPEGIKALAEGFRLTAYEPDVKIGFYGEVPNCAQCGEKKFAGQCCSHCGWHESNGPLHASPPDGEAVEAGLGSVVWTDGEHVTVEWSNLPGEFERRLSESEHWRR